MKTLIGILFSSLLTATAFATKLPVQKNTIGPQSVKIPATFTADYDFEGIVALNNCSGSLIQLDGMNDNSQALILTNGHCVEGGFTEPGKVNYKIPSSRRFTLLNSSSGNAGQVFATELVYSTMTNTDMAIYKVRETYGQIKSRFGINPFRLDSAHPSLGENIQVISGYWKRGYQCGVENFIFQLKEDRWMWTDSIRYSRPGCETIGGTSGSPIVRAGTKVVIGVNNTGNEDGLKCAMNNPCEIDDRGNVSFTMGYSYGQQTHWVYSCVTATNDIDLTKEGCVLPK
jgi:V8-like Glu-specific endopeptidase